MSSDTCRICSRGFQCEFSYELKQRSILINITRKKLDYFRDIKELKRPSLDKLKFEI